MLWMSNIPCQTDNQRIQTLLPLLSALFIHREEAREKNREQSTAKTSYLKQEGCCLKPSQYCYQGSTTPLHHLHRNQSTLQGSRSNSISEGLHTTALCDATKHCWHHNSTSSQQFQHHSCLKLRMLPSCHQFWNCALGFHLQSVCTTSPNLLGREEDKWFQGT